MAESVTDYLRAGFARIGGVTLLHLAPAITRRPHRILVTVPLDNLVAAGLTALGLTGALLEAHPSDFALEPDEPDEAD